MTIKRSHLLLVLLSLAIGLLGLIFIRRLVDFPVYYAAGQSLLAGRTDLYAPNFALGAVMDYRYPPFFLLAGTPLWLLPYHLSAYLWYCASVLQLIGCVLILRALMNRNPIPVTAKLVTAFAVAPYVVQQLHYGNAHLLTIFLLFTALFLYVRGKAAASALLLALSITIKLVPLLVLPYFVLKKQWKYLAHLALFFLIINLAPASYFGLRQNAELFKTWFSHVVIRQDFHEINGPINLSLKGQVRRHLSPIDYTERIDGDVNYPVIHVAAFSRQQVDRLWMLLAALAYGVALALIWRRSRRAEQGKSEAENQKLLDRERTKGFVLEMGLLLCVMLLVGPLTSKIYFIALLWPVFFLAYYSNTENTAASRVNRRLLLFIAALNLILPLLPGSSIQRWLLVLGADFYVNLLLLIGLAFELLSPRSPLPIPNDAPKRRAPSVAKTS